ncbi:MAG: mechanosensitive ion channel family protein [Planctomycetota bacterium]|nr:mechanosensitive ion channel family protein [Planctomycetota bacterium]
MIQTPEVKGWGGEFPAMIAERWREWWLPVTENGWLLSLAAILAAFLIAKLGHLFLSVTVRAVTRRTKNHLDDLLVQRLEAPLIQSVVLLGFAVAGRLLIEDGQQADWVERGLLSLLAISWIVFAFRSTGLVLRAMAKNPKRFQVLSGPAYPLFDNALKVVLFFAGAWLVIKVWGFDTTSMLASAGIMGLAVGFAAQDTLANLFAGVFILADRPYKVGDYIVIDSGERGRVNHIGLRSTRLLTRDDTEITIPNRIMGQAKIVNETGGFHEKMRVRIPVGVAYGSDLTRVRQTLLDAAAASPHVERDPIPRVRFRQFGDSSLDFELLVWVAQPEFKGLCIDDLLERIYLAFARDGISIPFPQRDLWMRTAPSAAE